MSVLYHIPREGEYHFVQCSNAVDAILRVTSLECCRFYRQAPQNSIFALRLLWLTDRIRRARQPASILSQKAMHLLMR